MATDIDRKKDYNEAYRHAFSIWGEWLAEAKTDLKCFLGDQWSTQDKAYLAEQRRNVLVWNKIRRVVKLIEGYQRKNRLSLKIDPVEGSDELTASQFSAICQWVMQSSNGYQVMSDAFSGGMLKTGFNLVELYLDYNDDSVYGDIRFRRIPYNKFLVDPNFFERDGSDTGYILRREWLTKEQAGSIIPTHAKEINTLTPKGRDEKYVDTPTAKDMFGKDKLRYDEFWVERHKLVTYVLDRAIGKMIEWQGTEDRLRELLNAYGERIVSVDRSVKYLEKIVIIEEQVFETENEPEYPFIPIIGFYDPEYDSMKLKLQGIVRCMRDPQTEVNRRRSKMLDIIDSQLSSGWRAKQGSVTNPDTLFGSGQGKVVWYEEKANLEDAVPIDPPQIPPSMFQLQELMDKDVVEIPGANSELFGMPESDDLQVAGILAKLRQGAGLTILQDIFDNYRFAKKIVGQKLIRIIQREWKADKIQRIINEQPSQEFFNQKFGKYDCVPTEGILTDTQRQMYFSQLLLLKQMEAPIPWAAIIDAMPLENKKDLQKMIQQAEQQQTKAGQLEQAMQMAELMAVKAKTASDLANAQEQRAQAIENAANATLDRIKTLNEMGRLGDEHILKLVQFVRDLEAGEQTIPAVRPKKVLEFTRR